MWTFSSTHCNNKTHPNHQTHLVGPFQNAFNPQKPNKTRWVGLFLESPSVLKPVVGIVNSSCLWQDWEYLLSSDYHRHFSAVYDCDLGFASSAETEAILTAGNLACPDVDPTAPLFTHIAAVLFALHLVYEVIMLDTFFVHHCIFDTTCWSFLYLCPFWPVFICTNKVVMFHFGLSVNLSTIQGFRASLKVLESAWIFSRIFNALKVLENRVGAWKSLNLSYLVLDSPRIFLPCNTVICGWSCYWNDEH